jgi:hypothetical protein
MLPKMSGTSARLLVLAALALVGACAPALPGGASPTAAAAAGTIAPDATSPSRSPALSTRDQAVARARAAVPKRAGAGALQADLGRFGDLGNASAASLVSPRPDGDRLVWRVNLGTVQGPLDGDGTIVILDFADGSVIEVFDWIS